jgi:hypothetical protein
MTLEQIEGNEPIHGDWGDEGDAIDEAEAPPPWTPPERSQVPLFIYRF